MKLRLATKNDETAYLHMVRRFYHEGKFPFPLDMARQSAVFQTFVEHDTARIWLVEFEGKAVGYMLASCRLSAFSGETLATENMLWIDHGYRRGGKAAGLLMDAFLEWARSIGADRANVSSQASMRPKATARFYRRFGFEESEIHYARRF